MAVSASLLGVQGSTGVDARADRVATSAAFAGTSGNMPRQGLVPTYGGGLAVAPAGGLSVTVATGQIVLAAPQAGHGGWVVTNDAALTITLDSAHASNARIDLIIARVADPFYTSGGDGLPAIKKITGTASASPLPPTVPATEGVYEVIKQITVPSIASGVTALTTAHIADATGDRLRWTSTVGGALRVANLAERDAALTAGTVYPGMSVHLEAERERHELTLDPATGDLRWLRNKPWTGYTPTAERDNGTGNNNPLTWSIQRGWYRIVDSVVEGSASLVAAGSSDPYDNGKNFRISIPMAATATWSTTSAPLLLGSWKEFYGNGSFSNGIGFAFTSGSWMLLSRAGVGAAVIPPNWYRDFSNYVGDAGATIVSIDFRYPID